MLAKVTLYVYNSNPNDIDELLGVGQTQFQTLMTPALTKSQILLRDAKGNHLSSLVQIQHQNANPPFNNINSYNNQTAIRIHFLGITANSNRSLNWINSFINKIVILQYGDELQQLTQSANNTTFQFNPQCFQIQVKLQLSQQIILKGQLSLFNVIQNSFLRVKLYYGSFEVMVMLAIGFNPNGYLPINTNILSLQIASIAISPTKTAPNSWLIQISGIHGSQLIKTTNQKIQLYVENNTKLLCQYFEALDEATIKQRQPFTSSIISLNSLKWSNTLLADECLTMNNDVRGVTITINIKCEMIKTGHSSIPVFSKPDLSIDEGHSTVKINQIKATGIYLNQLLPEGTLLYFIYVSNLHNTVVFSPFALKNSSEYIINTRQTIKEDPTGEILLLTFDQFFGKDNESASKLQNHLICKISVKNIKELSSSKITYSEKFLAFSKKKSLVQPCKKFDSMIKDKTLSLKLSYLQFPSFSSGLLTINNCIVEGSRNSRVNLAMIFDDNQLHASGEGDTYIMEKPYTILIISNGMQFIVSENRKVRQIHCNFQEVFGATSPTNDYKVSIPFSQSKKLTITWNYKQLKSQSKPMASQQVNQMQSFTPSTQIRIRLHSAYVQPQNCKSYTFRVSKGSKNYESLPYTPFGQLIRFRYSEQIHFDSKCENDYIFFNLSFTNSEGELVIHVGHHNVKNIIGKGFYEVTLLQMGNQQKKCNSILIFEVLNNIPLTHSAVNLSVKSLRFTQPSSFRSLYKYYFVAEQNNIPISMIELNKTNDLLTTNENLFIKNGENFTWKLYWSANALSKDAFWRSEKELIGIHHCKWTEIQPNGLFQMRYVAPKDAISKLNSTGLAILETSSKILISYSTQQINYNSPQTSNTIAKPIDIQVLSGLAAYINILSAIPYSSYQKILSLSLQPFNLQFCSQSLFNINQQFVTLIPNKKLAITANVNKKKMGRFVRENQESVVNFKGKKIKTTQTVQFCVNFPGICLITAQAVLLSSKFTNNHNGILTLISLGCDSSKVKHVSIYPLQHPNQIKLDYPNITPISIDFSTNRTISINKQLPTNSITFCLYFIIKCQGNQLIQSKVDLAKIHIDKLQDKPFRYQWIISNGPVLMYFEASYHSTKVQQINGESVEYAVQEQNTIEKVTRQLNTKDKLQLVSEARQKEVVRPERKRGYTVMLHVPDSLKISAASVVLEDLSVVELRKSDHKGKLYAYTSEVQLQIKTIQIQSQTMNIQRIEQLQQKNLSRRFLINRNPAQLIQLISEPYALAACKTQQFTINFTFHQIFSKESNSKIVWLRNNKNDEILTRNLALMVKHDKQKKMIRIIDQFGQIKPNQINGEIEGRTVSFGYQPTIDELEIYLCIHHILNEKESPDNLWTDNFDNWTKLFPIAYGKINISKAQTNTMIGCQLQKMDNCNQTLDKHVNQIITLPNLSCLGSISMQKRNWGYITIRLSEISEMKMQMFPTNSLIYFTFEVKNSNHAKIVGFTTEARQFYKVQNLKFISNQLQFFYLQTVGQSEHLLISANILNFNMHYKVFQKSVDLSEYLRMQGEHNIVTQIKPTQCQSLKNIVQMKLVMQNRNEPLESIDIVEEAKNVNKVDLVSYEGHSQDELVMRLLQCQQVSHLYETLREVKQSVIYSEQPQSLLFKQCGYYLQFQNDSKIISTVLQMMNIELLRYPSSVTKLSNIEISKIYTNIKALFEGSSLSNPKTSDQPNTLGYSQLISKFNKNELDNYVKLQKRKLYTDDQLIKYDSTIETQLLIPLLQQFAQKLKQFRGLLKTDIQDWNAVMAHKSNAVYVQYIGLLDKIYIDENHTIPQEVIQTVLTNGLQKDIPFYSLIEIWSKLSIGKMMNHATTLFNKAIEKLPSISDNQTNINGFRTLINYLTMNKINIPIQNWSNAVEQCMTVLKRSTDCYILNLYAQMICKIASLGLLQQKTKVKLVECLKLKVSQERDNNAKLVLSNLIERIVGKKQMQANQSNASKMQFYKKYLITYD